MFVVAVVGVDGCERVYDDFRIDVKCSHFLLFLNAFLVISYARMPLLCGCYCYLLCVSYLLSKLPF